MKVIRAILVVFVLSFIVELTGVKAEDTHYYMVLNQVSIPSAWVSDAYYIGDYEKVNDYSQSLETFTWSDDAQARIRGMVDPVSATGWIQVNHGKTVTFNNTTTLYQSYRLELKSRNIFAGAVYSGSWRINMPA